MSSRASDFERFFPEVAATEARLGPSTTQEAFVAILVDATVVVRTSWSDDVEVSEKLFEQLRRDELPKPSFERGTTFRVLAAESRRARVRKCGACFALPGKQFCTICGGTGEVGSGDQIERCTSCQGGKRVCSTCEGTQRSVRVKLEFGEDKVRAAPQIFVFGVAGSTKQRMLEFFRARRAIPPELAIDLAQDFARADAYRGRKGTDEVWGYSAGTSLAHARTYLERLDKLPSVVAMRHSVFAWPFLVLSAEQSTVVCVADERGETHVLG